jgi:hypothetical protein
MISSKTLLVEESKELEGVILMYKEAFPDNPAFAVGKKKDKKSKPQ